VIRVAFQLSRQTCRTQHCRRAVAATAIALWLERTAAAAAFEQFNILSQPTRCMCWQREQQQLVHDQRTTRADLFVAVHIE